ncbi:hypothetical protein GUJ93_ZPchr0003g16863 [Zizania palustris]|uniref:Uncharacterized protein n=1 Tax=Zizania palustris TaxID=103762 RepID=A0A8J5VY27_ZIZPA|nr:hypothetical protein GUJ93_ZPchr0003g16863 [Zizania palustris]
MGQRHTCNFHIDKVHVPFVCNVTGKVQGFASTDATIVCLGKWQARRTSRAAFRAKLSCFCLLVLLVLLVFVSGIVLAANDPGDECARNEAYQGYCPPP